MTGILAEWRGVDEHDDGGRTLLSPTVPRRATSSRVGGQKKSFTSRPAGPREEEAIKHVKSLIYKTWQKMNQEVANSPFSRDFNVTAWELSRTATFFYYYGDDTYTVQDSDFKDHVYSLLFQPFPVPSTSYVEA